MKIISVQVDFQKEDCSPLCGSYTSVLTPLILMTIPLAGTLWYGVGVYRFWCYDFMVVRIVGLWLYVYEPYSVY